MTHEYTLLLGGTVIPGDGSPDATAIAWAAGVILAVGSDAAIRAISRGDSVTIALDGAVVIAAGEPLEVGAPADLEIHARDPRAATARGGRDPGFAVAGGTSGPVAVIRHGHLVREIGRAHV